jgi:MFS transporter, DHA2 family, methylenomycin A resistance protein
MAGNMLSGRLGGTGRPGAARRPIAVGATIMAGGCLAMIAASGAAPLVGGLIVTAGGLGLVMPAMTGLALSSAEPGRSGIASGALTAMRQAGSVFGVALFGSLAGPHVTVLAPELVISAALSAGVAVLSSVIR